MKVHASKWRVVDYYRSMRDCALHDGVSRCPHCFLRLWDHSERIE